MGRTAVTAFLVVLLLGMGASPLFNVHDAAPSALEETTSPAYTSNLQLAFSNGPASGSSITGQYQLSFALTGNANVSSLLIELSSDGASWTTITNLTSVPWLTYFDSTAHANGTYNLRATAWDDDVNESVVVTSNSFSIANQVPLITIFTALNADVGSGDSAGDRAWFSIAATDAIAFRWGASDDDLTYATLANAPGPGAPSNDGPNSLNYGWDWTSGAMSEGTYNPLLTIHDDSGLSASDTLFIGIDRTGPTLGTLTVGSGNAWQNTGTVVVSGLMTSADDGQGSGVASCQFSSDGTTWSTVTTDSTTFEFEEGNHTVQFRSLDRVGNIGPISQVEIRVDETAPEPSGWVVDELTTSRVGPANVSFNAQDDGSGIDSTASYMQYGFDSNGVGQTPDLSGRWLNFGVDGLDATVALSNWATKSRQHLMLRAVVVDQAGNEYTSNPSSFQILPGLDLFWNATETNLDRLIVRPGENSGNVTITSVLESNQDYGGSIVVRLESAPADRTAAVSWTVMEARTLPSGTLSDSTETLIWNYTVPQTGQYDLRLVIDYLNVIDEYDEGNNNNHMVVTGASIGSPGLVPSFAPSLLIVLFVGIAIGLLQRRTRL
ncbi:MAG: CARDB domain-containing protein [Candidatus Poseidoniaceae archaeon]